MAMAAEADPGMTASDNTRAVATATAPAAKASIHACHIDRTRPLPTRAQRSGTCRPEGPPTPPHLDFDVVSHLPQRLVSEPHQAGGFTTALRFSLILAVKSPR